MGGNALSQPSVRLTAKEYKDLEIQLEPFLNEMFEKWEVVKTYKDKKDFGDMDIIVCHYSNTFRYELLFEQLNPTEIVRNGEVTSFGINTNKGVFQIDLIKTNQLEFDSTKTYYQNGDLGNMLGRIFHRLGLLYGAKGLIFPIYFEGQHIDSFKLELPSFKIYRILGLQEKEEFQTMEEIFDYAINSPLFDYRLFQLDELDAKNKNRNSKRLMYTKFLDYIKENNITKTNDLIFNFSRKGGVPDQLETLKFLSEHIQIDLILDEILKVQKSETLKKIARHKFNGNLVSGITGFKFQELGEFIVFFKKTFPEIRRGAGFGVKKFDEVIVETPKYYIEQSIELLANTFSEMKKNS